MVVCVPCAILMHAHMKNLRERHGQAWGKSFVAVMKVIEVEDDEWSNHINGYDC